MAFLATSLIVEGLGLLSVSGIVDLIDMSVDSFFFLVIPTAILQFGFWVSLKVDKYRKHLSALGTYFLFPLMLSCIFLMVIYLMTGSVKGAFSRAPVEVTSESSITAIRIILWRFFWDIGYSGLAAFIVALVTPAIAAFFEFFYNEIYLRVLKILKGYEAKAVPIREKKANYRFFVDFKAFLLLNALFSACVILFLPRVTGKIYTEVTTPYGNFLIPYSMYYMTIPAVLSCVLMIIRERSFHIYWDYFKFLIAFLSVSNVVTFAWSPLARGEFMDLLTIVPGLYFYNILGLSFFAMVFRRELLPRLSRGTKLLFTSSVIAGFVLFMLYATFVLLPHPPLMILVLISGLLDAMAIATTIYTLTLIVQKITRIKYHSKTLFLETFLCIMIANVIYGHYLSNGTLILEEQAPLWLILLCINVLGGLVFFTYPRLAFLIIGISIVLSTLVYSFFGWFQIMSTLGSVLISLRLKSTDTHHDRVECLYFC